MRGEVRSSRSDLKEHLIGTWGFRKKKTGEEIKTSKR